MKRMLTIFIGAIVWLFAAVVLFWVIRDYLWTHAWWQSLAVSLPEIAIPILAYFELRHSEKANTLRTEANSLSMRISDLEAERNQHLQQIAKNTERPVTQAERNANILREHLRAKVSVSGRSRHLGYHAGNSRGQR